MWGSNRAKLLCRVGMQPSTCQLLPGTKSPPRMVALWFWTVWVGIKSEAVIKVKTANVDFLILQISQLRQKRS